MIDIIKEYLISLGFKTDNSSLQSAQNAMNSVEKSVDSFVSSSVKGFAKAGVAVVTFVATANIALGKYLVSLAQSDLQTEMFARRMWMNKDAAKAYQSSIDALGVSINDLYLSPELMQKYLELNKEARDMAVPNKEYSEQMKIVRDITFEFQRLKLEGAYALQWIGYYLTKYLAGPLGDSRDWLKKINDEIHKDMPEWTKEVAQVASWFVRLGVAAWDIRQALGAVLGVLAGFKMISMLTNPLGLLILGMTALLLLVDDFNTYASGGESAFPKFWEWVERLKKSLKDNGTIKEFRDDLHEVVQELKGFGVWLDKIGESKSFQEMIKDIDDISSNLIIIIRESAGWLKSFYKEIKENGDLKELSQDVSDLADSSLKLVAAIEKLMLKVGKGGLGEALKNGLVNTLETIDGLIKSITGGLKILTGLISGDTSTVNEGIGKFVEGADTALLGPERGKKAWDWQKSVGDYFAQHSVGDTFSNALKNSQNSPWSKFLESIGMSSRTNNDQDVGAQWEAFKDSISGSESPNVDWSALKKGFVSFMNSIPKEFGDISKGIFQTAKSYGGSGALGGMVAMNYLYPQSNTSNTSQLSVKQTYNIYGAEDPQSVATTVNRTSTAALTRYHQGVIR